MQVAPLYKSDLVKRSLEFLHLEQCEDCHRVEVVTLVIIKDFH